MVPVRRLLNAHRCKIAMLDLGGSLRYLTLQLVRLVLDKNQHYNMVPFFLPPPPLGYSVSFTGCLADKVEYSQVHSFSPS